MRAAKMLPSRFDEGSYSAKYYGSSGTSSYPSWLGSNTDQYDPSNPGMDPYMNSRQWKSSGSTWRAPASSGTGGTHYSFFPSPSGAYPTPATTSSWSIPSSRSTRTRDRPTPRERNNLVAIKTTSLSKSTTSSTKGTTRSVSQKKKTGGKLESTSETDLKPERKGLKASASVSQGRIKPASQDSPKKSQNRGVRKSGKESRGRKGKMNGFGAFGPRGGYYGGNRKFGNKKMFKKRDNQQDDIPFVPIPEGEQFTTHTISFDNVQCFHGFQSIFTTQHMFPVLIDGNIYESVDHYYQIEKTKQLCGSTSENLTATVRDQTGKRLDGKIGFRSHEEKSFSAIAREMIRLNNVPKEKVEEWRHTKGLQIIQKALLCKVAQCPEFREALRSSGDKILIHSYAGDAIYGSGTRLPGIKSWCDEMQKNAGKLMIPLKSPLDENSVQQCPVVAKGRNVLGVIMMQLRHKVVNDNVEVQDMSLVFDALRGGPGRAADADMDDIDAEINGFSIGGGSIQPPIGTI